jgi:hypothetical protein
MVPESHINQGLLAQTSDALTLVPHLPQLCPEFNPAYMVGKTLQFDLEKKSYYIEVDFKAVQKYMPPDIY